MKLRTLLAPAALVVLAVVLLGPTRSARAGFTTNGIKLVPSYTFYWILDNFSDPESNDNLAHDPNVPGANGAALAIRKAAIEWCSGTYGDGSGDPTQPNLGDGGSRLDFWFGGLTSSPGGAFQSHCSALSGAGGCTPGILAFSTLLPAGSVESFLMRFCDAGYVFADGPSQILPNEYDLQSVAAHEFGHLAGLGHTTPDCGDAPTMSPTILPGDVSNRSIEAEDIAGVQAVHGVQPANDPVITGVSVDGSGNLVVSGANFFSPQTLVRLTTAYPSSTIVGAYAAPQNNGTLLTIPLPAIAASGDVVALRVDASLAPQDISAPFPFQLPTGTGAPTFYCTPRASSIGCVTTITTTDPLAQPISGAADYSVIAVDVHGFKPGLMFFGLSGPAAIFPWAGGYLCMNPPLVRGLIQVSGGSGPNSCDGSFTQVVNDGGAYSPYLDQGPGFATWFQWWYREPDNGSGLLGTALSDAVEIVYGGP